MRHVRKLFAPGLLENSHCRAAEGLGTSSRDASRNSSYLFGDRPVRTAEPLVCGGRLRTRTPVALFVARRTPFVGDCLGYRISDLPDETLLRSRSSRPRPRRPSRRRPPCGRLATGALPVLLRLLRAPDRAVELVPRDPRRSVRSFASMGRRSTGRFSPATRSSSTCATR